MSNREGESPYVEIHDTKRETSEAAAAKAASLLNKEIEEKGTASFVAATGKSQFDFFDSLINDQSVPWEKTEMFHLDEYIGLSPNHDASFVKYLRERFTNHVDIGEIHFIEGDVADPAEECNRLNELIAGKDIAASFVGIGENAHLAFNDPPADFEVEDPYIIVELDEDCRKQQVGEGWFEDMEAVPTHAISMSIKQIMRSQSIICTVPGKRKAEAVRNTLEGEVSPNYPASIMQRHPDTTIYLDKDSASLLEHR